MHVGIKDLHASRAAVVVHENDQGIFGNAPLLQLSHEATDIFIDVVDHAEKALGIGIESFPFVEGTVLRLGDVGTVRCIGGDVAVERRSFFLLLQPAGGLRKKDISAVALGLFESAVVKDGGIEIFIVRRITTAAWIGLANAPSTVDKHFVKASAVWLISGFVSEVPFAKNASGVACALEDLSESRHLEAHALALENGVSDTVAEFMLAREQG